MLATHGRTTGKPSKGSQLLKLRSLSSLAATRLTSSSWCMTQLRSRRFMGMRSRSRATSTDFAQSWSRAWANFLRSTRGSIGCTWQTGALKQSTLVALDGIVMRTLMWTPAPKTTPAHLICLKQMSILVQLFRIVPRCIQFVEQFFRMLGSFSVCEADFPFVRPIWPNSG